MADWTHQHIDDGHLDEYTTAVAIPVKLTITHGSTDMWMCYLYEFDWSCELYADTLEEAQQKALAWASTYGSTVILSGERPGPPT